MIFPKCVLELYTHSAVEVISKKQWRQLLSNEYCQYLEGKCDKIRKSQPDVSIGTCIVGFKGIPTIICPHRLLERRQIFLDALHLLKYHTPGNQLHIVPEITIPGGSVDYFMASVNRGQIKDYLALEIQALDTTGTVWPARQQFVSDVLDLQVDRSPVSKASYGMNWKMTAKTTLIQLHHKLETLELLNKKMVVVFQDVLYDYVVDQFSASGLRDAEHGDSIHFHVYTVEQAAGGPFQIELASRRSTTTAGIAQMLGLRQSTHMSEEDLLARIQTKISDSTLLKI